MAPAVTSLNSENLIHFFAYYVNATSRIQKVRMTDSCKGIKFEKIVFPGQRILFETLLEFNLEVYADISGQEVLLETLPCYSLRILEEIDLFDTRKAG